MLTYEGAALFRLVDNFRCCDISRLADDWHRLATLSRLADDLPLRGIIPPGG